MGCTLRWVLRGRLEVCGGLLLRDELIEWT